MHIYIYAYPQISVFFSVDIYKDRQYNEDNKEKTQDISPTRLHKTKELANGSQIRIFKFQVSFRQIGQMMWRSPCPQLQKASSCLWENGTVQMGLCVLPHPYVSGMDEGQCNISGALSHGMEILIYFKIQQIQPLIITF